MHPADREILDHFLRIRERTIDLLVRIPDDLLDRTAPGEAHPSRRWFLHMARAIDDWMAELMLDGEIERALKDYGVAIRTVDADGIVEALRLSAQRLVTFFEAKDGRMMSQTYDTTLDNGGPVVWTGRDRVLYLTDHEVHHRGKVVLAMRQWGFGDIPQMPTDW